MVYVYPEEVYLDETFISKNHSNRFTWYLGVVHVPALAGHTSRGGRGSGQRQVPQRLRGRLFSKQGQLEVAVAELVVYKRPPLARGHVEDEKLDDIYAGNAEEEYIGRTVFENEGEDPYLDEL